MVIKNNLWFWYKLKQHMSDNEKLDRERKADF